LVVSLFCYIANPIKTLQNKDLASKQKNLQFISFLSSFVKVFRLDSSLFYYNNMLEIEFYLLLSTYKWSKDRQGLIRMAVYHKPSHRAWFPMTKYQLIVHSLSLTSLREPCNGGFLHNKYFTYDSKCSISLFICQLFCST
jgi:hypothetical protein